MPKKKHRINIVRLIAINIAQRIQLHLNTFWPGVLLRGNKNEIVICEFKKAPVVKIIATDGSKSNQPNRIKPTPSTVLIIGPIELEIPCCFLVIFSLSGTTSIPGNVILIGERIITIVMIKPILVSRYRDE